MCQGYKGVGAILGGEDTWRLPAGHGPRPLPTPGAVWEPVVGSYIPSCLGAPGAQSGHRLH